MATDNDRFRFSVFVGVNEVVCTNGERQLKRNVFQLVLGLGRRDVGRRFDLRGQAHSLSRATRSLRRDEGKRPLAREGGAVQQRQRSARSGAGRWEDKESEAFAFDPRPIATQVQVGRDVAKGKKKLRGVWRAGAVG